MSVKDAIQEFRRGRKVLIYDFDEREGETDIAQPAISVSPKDVAFMRIEGGGLLCVAIHPRAAELLGLPYVSSILSSHPTLAKVVEREGDLSYDKRSAFSIWVNHRDVFTGITDVDRSLTIRELGRICEKVLNGEKVEFGKFFRTPGHVPILRAADGLLNERVGQTELSIALACMAGVVPAIALCEMLDAETGRALSKRRAMEYGREKGIVFVEGREIVEEFSKHPMNYVWCCKHDEEG